MEEWVTFFWQCLLKRIQLFRFINIEPSSVDVDRENIVTGQTEHENYTMIGKDGKMKSSAASNPTLIQNFSMTNLTSPVSPTKIWNGVNTDSAVVSYQI